MALCRMFVRNHAGGRDGLLCVGVSYVMLLRRFLPDILLVLIAASWWNAVYVITVW